MKGFLMVFGTSVGIALIFSFGYGKGKHNADKWYARQHLFVAVDTTRLDSGVCRAVLADNYGNVLEWAERAVDPIVDATLPNGCEVKRAWIALKQDDHDIPTGTMGAFTYYACQPSFKLGDHFKPMVHP